MKILKLDLNKTNYIIFIFIILLVINLPDCTYHLKRKVSSKQSNKLAEFFLSKKKPETKNHLFFKDKDKIKNCIKKFIIENKYSCDQFEECIYIANEINSLDKIKSYYEDICNFVYEKKSKKCYNEIKLLGNDYLKKSALLKKLIKNKKNKTVKLYIEKIRQYSNWINSVTDFKDYVKKSYNNNKKEDNYEENKEFFDYLNKIILIDEKVNTTFSNLSSQISKASIPFKFRKIAINGYKFVKNYNIDAKKNQINHEYYISTNPIVFDNSPTNLNNFLENARRKENEYYIFVDLNIEDCYGYEDNDNTLILKPYTYLKIKSVKRIDEFFYFLYIHNLKNIVHINLECLKNFSKLDNKKPIVINHSDSNIFL